MIRALSGWLSQTAALAAFSLRNVAQRIDNAVATVLGVAGVVLVFVGVLSVAAGFKSTLANTGDPANALVLRSGSDTEMTSGLGVDEVRVVADSPGVLRAGSHPVASAELLVIVNLPKRSTGSDANVPLRGVEPSAFAVRPRLHVTRGRAFVPGRNEIIVGEAAAAQLKGLGVGERQTWNGTVWTVVGHFSSGGTLEDSEIMTDARVLQSVYRRGNSFQSVHVRLASPEALSSFRSTLLADPRLNVRVLRESEYYAQQAAVTTALIKTLGALIACLMGLGAIFASLNTMYTAVAARSRQIATLRALGFGAGSVVVAVLIESLALALAGGTLGGGLAYVLFHDVRATTLNLQTFSQVAFAFNVNASILTRGILLASVIGFFGGIFPALRAARLSIARALRDI